MNTIALSSLRASTWLIEHGQDPSVWIEKGIQAAQQALKINQNYSFAYGNIGTILMNKSFYELFSNTNKTNTSQSAIEQFKKMIKISGPSPDVLCYISIIHQIEAEQAIINDSDPSKFITNGIEALTPCINTNKPDPYCIEAKSRLLSSLAKWKFKNNRSFQEAIETSFNLSRTALIEIREDQDALLYNGEIVLLFTSIVPMSVAKKFAIIQESVGGLDRALANQLGWPRALVVKGALLRVRAQGERGIQRQSTLRMARDALKEGLAGNPLLRRQYGTTLAELEQQLAP